jgi:hypothetical protein
MYKIDNIVRLIIPWVLLGFGVVYLADRFMLAVAFILMAIYFWVRKPLKNSSSRNLGSRLFFMFILATLALFLNSLKSFFPPGDMSLFLLGLILACAVGVLLVSTFVDIVKTKA